MANKDIFWAKQNGTDTVQAQKHADNALETLGTLAVMWHEFNLTHFEDELKSANAEVIRAENIVNPPAPSPTKTEARGSPGFTGIFVLISIAAILFFMKRNRE